MPEHRVTEHTTAGAGVTREIDTQVAIVGAGPAGLTLARMLGLQGIDCVVLERSSDGHIRGRQRAGLIESTTRELMVELGAGERMVAESHEHTGFYLRHRGVTHHLDFQALVGRSATLYPQYELVSDLIDLLAAEGPAMHFDTEVERIAGYADPATAGSGDRPVVVEARGPGGPVRVRAAFAAACDGFHGVGRRTLLTEHAGTVSMIEREYPFAWLGILARTAPDPDEGMYCTGPGGMSLHSMRGPRLTRQYLQVPIDTRLGDWSDDRIWSELSARSESVDHPPLETGEIIDRSLIPLRSAVVEPMHMGRLFLLGDSAHIVPPTGAKGLNLAVSDASVLSRALGIHHAGGGTSALDAYGATASARVWQSEMFSWSMTALLHAFDQDPFSWRVRAAQLDHLVSSRSAQRALGEIYVGTPFPTHWLPDGAGSGR